METIHEKVSEGNRYGLTPALRAWFCETYQVNLSIELGVVCVRGFTLLRKRRKAHLKWVLDSETGIEEPQIVSGEIEEQEEHDAIFLMPLTRYDYKSGSGLKHVRISLAQLKECQLQHSRKDELHLKYPEEVLKRAGVKVSKRRSQESKDKVATSQLAKFLEDL